MGAVAHGRDLRFRYCTDEPRVHQLARRSNGEEYCIDCKRSAPKDLAEIVPPAPRAAPAWPAPSRLAAIDPRLAPPVRQAAGQVVVDASAMFRNRHYQETPT